LSYTYYTTFIQILVTNRNKPSFVAMPFSDYQEIADILLELNSPGLIDDIAQSRKEYEENRTTDFRDFLKSEKNIYQ